MESKKPKNLAVYESWISILINTVLFAGKLWAGIVTGSVAIVADAWHTASDSISSVILLVGIKLMVKPADREHPFGHGRAELISALLISVLLAIIAFNFLLDSIAQLRGGQPVNFGLAAIVVTILSILLKEALAQFAFYAGRKTKLQSLKAEGWHHRSDAISSLLILVGIFLGSYFWWIDGILGIAVSMLIFYATYEIMLDAINPLLGEEPDPQIVKQIKDICHLRSEDLSDIHHFHMHRYGHHTELTFHLRMPGHINLDSAHEIVTDIEKEIKEKLQIESTIHIEPTF